MSEPTPGFDRHDHLTAGLIVVVATFCVSAVLTSSRLLVWSGCAVMLPIIWRVFVGGHRWHEPAQSDDGLRRLRADSDDPTEGAADA